VEEIKVLRHRIHVTIFKNWALTFTILQYKDDGLMLSGVVTGVCSKDQLSHKNMKILQNVQFIIFKHVVRIVNTVL
jgi:hypothetical protein